MGALTSLFSGQPARMEILSAALLVAARILPLTLLAPWLAMRDSPWILRAALVFGLTACVAPLALASATSVPQEPSMIALAAIRESLVGLVFAIAAVLPFYALQWGGHLADLWRGSGGFLGSGLAAGSLQDSNAAQTTPLASLYFMTGVVIFLALGGHRFALSAFAQGLVDVPIGNVISQAQSSTGAVALGAARLVGHGLSFAVAVAAPAAVTIVLIELALGFAARATPEMPIVLLTPLRAAVGLAALMLTVSLLGEHLPNVFREAMHTAQRLMRGL